MPVKLVKYLMALCGVAVAGASVAQGPIAMTESGRVAGSVSNGVQSWKGIPFAAPSVGVNRWRAPQPPAPADRPGQPHTDRGGDGR